jgi:hypothetical protein
MWWDRVAFLGVLCLAYKSVFSFDAFSGVLGVALIQDCLFLLRCIVL